VSTIIFLLVAAFCVMAFGKVSSGSITAFLVEQQQKGGGGDEEENLQILNLANLLVSLAVLLTYPLQLYPSYELIGPAVAKYFTNKGSMRLPVDDDDDDDEEGGADGYVAANSDDEGGVNAMAGRLSPTPADVQAPFSDEDAEESQRRRGSEGIMITDTLNSAQPHAETSYWNYYGTSYGDTPTIRIVLVLITYLIAIVVPNVQLLVSVAGAVSGSATGLLVPPLLQRAYWKKMEREERQQQLQEEGSSTFAYGYWYYQRRRLTCYILFLLGCIVLVIGSTSSIWDIVKVYRGVA